VKCVRQFDTLQILSRRNKNTERQKTETETETETERLELVKNLLRRAIKIVDDETRKLLNCEISLIAPLLLFEFEFEIEGSRRNKSQDFFSLSLPHPPLNHTQVTCKKVYCSNSEGEMITNTK